MTYPILFPQVDKKITKLLADMPNMQYAGSNTNLTITTDSLSLVIMETGDVSISNLTYSLPNMLKKTIC